MGHTQASNCQPSAGSAVVGPRIRRRLVQTWPEGLLGGLHWEAAKLASRLILPATGPRVPTTCWFVYTVFIHT